MGKLEETFNLEPTGENDDELFTLDVPDDADLSDVARLALEAYKSQIESIMIMEPKYRARSLEVARQFLDVAKDAMSKDQELQLKWKKVESDSNKKQILTEDEKKQESALTRNAILVDFNNARKSAK